MPGKTCPSHATGNVVMITYAALSHAFSVVFDRCTNIFDIARLEKRFFGGCDVAGCFDKIQQKTLLTRFCRYAIMKITEEIYPYNLTNVGLWGFFMPEKTLS